MPLARAVGYGANYASNGTVRYIPEIWAGKLIENYYKASTVAAVTSTEYEGQIKAYGDNVIIRTEPLVSINNYAVGDVLTYQVPTSTSIALAIDTAKSWAIAVDDIDKVQSDLSLMQTFSASAAENLKVAVDGDVLSRLLGGAAINNKGATAGLISGNLNLGATTTPVVVTALNVISTILSMAQALDEQNVPDVGRFIVIPSAMARLLKESDLRQVQITGDGTSPLRNGKIGMIDRFTVYVSNNLPTGVAGTLAAGETAIYAGVPSATAFASQIVKNETLPSPDTFGHLMRGLQVYGMQVVKPEGLVEAIVSV